MRPRFTFAPGVLTAAASVAGSSPLFSSVKAAATLVQDDGEPSQVEASNAMERFSKTFAAAPAIGSR